MPIIPLDDSAFFLAIITAIAFFLIYKTRKEYPVLNHMAPIIFLLFAVIGVYILTLIPPSATPVALITTNDITGGTAGLTLCTFTPTATGTYRLGGYITITAVSLDVLQLQGAYTDEVFQARNQLFFPQGVTSANLNAAGAYIFPTMDIRSSAGNTITIKTALTIGTGSVAYDAGCSIEEIS